MRRLVLLHPVVGGAQVGQRIGQLRRIGAELAAGQLDHLPRPRQSERVVAGVEGGAELRVGDDPLVLRNSTVTRSAASVANANPQQASSVLISRRFIDSRIAPLRSAGDQATRRPARQACGCKPWPRTLRVVPTPRNESPSIPRGRSDRPCLPAAAAWSAASCCGCCSTGPTTRASTPSRGGRCRWTIRDWRTASCRSSRCGPNSPA